MRSLDVCLLMVLALALSFGFNKSVAVEVGETPFGVTTGGNSSPCCKECICRASKVAECQCQDVKTSCEKTCKSCRCTKSIPPQCRCVDYRLDNCYPPACRS